MKYTRNTIFYYLTPIIVVLGLLCLLAANLLGVFDNTSHTERGYAAFTQGQYIKAIKDLSRAQQLCETDLFARYYLGAAYHEYGWHDEALRQYESVLNLTTDLGARTLHSAGRIHMYRGERSQAAGLFHQALAIQPASPDILYDLGLLSLQQKDFIVAEQWFAEAVKNAPDNELYRQQLLSVSLQNRQNSQAASNEKTDNDSRQ